MLSYNYRSVMAMSEHRYSQINKNHQHPQRQRPRKIWRDEIWPNQIWPDQIWPGQIRPDRIRPDQIPVKSEQPESVRAPDRGRAA